MKRKLTREEYRNLCEAMREHPEVFQTARTLTEHVHLAEHLAAATMGKLPRRLTPKQSANLHTLARHIRTAEHLAATAGKLPAHTWLQARGCRNLVQAMRRHPEAFEG
jgi:mRNA degradation ribonuclease J1/J2